MWCLNVRCQFRPEENEAAILSFCAVSHRPKFRHENQNAHRSYSNATNQDLWFGIDSGICIAAALLNGLTILPAGADESIWTHNGSTVRWVSSGPDQWVSSSPTSLDRAVEHKCCFDRVRLGPLAFQRFVQRRGDQSDPHGSPLTWRNRIKF